jgi:hypothetical protein
MKSSMYGVTQHDALESIIACDVSSMQRLIAMSIAILINSLF